MALKFGRTAGITSRIDPVTGTTMYTEDEYDAYNTAVEAEKSRRSAYDESVKKFDTDYAGYYGKNTVDQKKAAEGAALVNMAGNKDRMGRTVTGTAAQGITQAESDRLVNERIKKGEIVSINDPSVTAKTRELLTAANKGNDISKGFIRKGQNFKDFGEIYGENFNPIEWQKSAKAGTLDKDGYQAGRSYTPVDAAGVSKIVGAPVDPGNYVAGPAIKKIETKNVDWKERKLDPLKPTKIDQKKGKLRMPKEEEDLTWQEPNFVKAKGVRVPQTRIKTSGKSGIEGGGKKKMVGGTEGSRIKYNTESRQSMAYFSGNTSIGDKITGKTESELRDLKKETRGEGVRMLKEGRLGDALTIGKDLGTIRKATRYAKKGDISIGSKTGSVKEGQESTLKYFTPERTKTNNEGAMYGYKEYKAQEKNKVEQARLEPAFRAMYDNAANRNTVGSQMEKLQGAAAPTNSYSSLAITRGQMKDKYATDNPTASRSQVRKGVRDQIDSNRKLMQEVDKKIIK